jgi:hypothetical protein
MNERREYCAQATMDNDGNDLVPAEDACPGCGERRMDWLVWDNDCFNVTCSTCGHMYDPAIRNA